MYGWHVICLGCGFVTYPDIVEENKDGRRIETHRRLVSFRLLLELVQCGDRLQRCHRCDVQGQQT